MPCIVEIQIHVKSASGVDSRITSTFKHRFEADDLDSLSFAREMNNLLNITGSSFKRIKLPSGFIEIKTPASSLRFWRYRLVTGNDAVMDDVYAYR